MRIPTKPLNQYPWYLRPLFWLQKKNYGAVLDSGLVWARSPRLFFHLALFYGAFERKRSPLAPALRSLIQVRVSQINNCSFCVDINTATLVKRGVPIEKVEALSSWRESALFSDLEKVVFAYVEAMSDSTQRVDDDLVSQLKGHFNEEAIVELTGLIAFQNMSAKFNAALAIPPQGFCKLPLKPTT